MPKVSQIKTKITLSSRWKGALLPKIVLKAAEKQKRHSSFDLKSKRNAYETPNLSSEPLPFTKMLLKVAFCLKNYLENDWVRNKCAFYSVKLLQEGKLCTSFVSASFTHKTYETDKTLRLKS